MYNSGNANDDERSGEKPVQAWGTYMEWNAAICEAFFPELPSPAPVYLDFEGDQVDALAELTGTPVDEVIARLAEATVFMGVPTMYVRLLDDERFDRRSCAGMRLFISGSAPLLPETFRQFEERTGMRILERYGMSETIMLTSNPYDGNRIAGTVVVKRRPA